MNQEWLCTFCKAAGAVEVGPTEAIDVVTARIVEAHAKAAQPWCKTDRYISVRVETYRVVEG